MINLKRERKKRNILKKFRKTKFNYNKFIKNFYLEKNNAYISVKVNNYTKENFVDYRDITKDLNDDFLQTKQMADGKRCSCANYLYVAQDGSNI